MSATDTERQRERLREALLTLMDDSGHEYYCDTHSHLHGYQSVCSCGYPDALKKADAALAPREEQSCL